MRKLLMIVALTALLASAGGCARKYQPRLLESNRQISQDSAAAAGLLTDCRRGDEAKCEALRQALERIGRESKQAADLLLAEDLLVLPPED